MPLSSHHLFVGVWCIWALVLTACGYRPAYELGREIGGAAHIPAFRSYVGYPELDVFAASYLAMGLNAQGVDTVFEPDRAQWLAQGIIQSSGETPVAFSSSQTRVQLSMAVSIEVTRPDGSVCRTPTVFGTAPLVVGYDAVSEADRQVALQAALMQAIDASVFDVLLCANGAS